MSINKAGLPSTWCPWVQAVSRASSLQSQPGHRSYFKGKEWGYDALLHLLSSASCPQVHALLEFYLLVCWTTQYLLWGSEKEYSVWSQMHGSTHTARRTSIHSGLTTEIQFLIYRINTISILIMANHTRACVFIVFQCIQQIYETSQKSWQGHCGRWRRKGWELFSLPMNSADFPRFRKKVELSRM